MTFSPMEHATVISLVALGIAVMQNDEERGKEYIGILSVPEVETAAEAVLNKLMAPLAPTPTLHLDA